MERQKIIKLILREWIAVKYFNHAAFLWPRLSENSFLTIAAKSKTYQIARYLIFLYHGMIYIFGKFAYLRFHAASAIKRQGVAMMTPAKSNLLSHN